MAQNGIVLGGRLNCRKSPDANAAAYGQFVTGTVISVSTCSNDEWWQTAWTNGSTGYVMKAYVAVASDTVQVTGTNVNVRPSPDTSESALYMLSSPATATVIGVATNWVNIDPTNGNANGWMHANYLEKITDDDNAGGTPTTYTFVPTNAVNYALNHSDNSGSGVACAKRNLSFASCDGNDDCADFVSQCLCAGGVPMFNGWFYRLSGIPSSWSNSMWQKTYSGCQQLLNKGWIEQVAYNAIQPGDIIYSYDSTATPTPYTHVTIAVTGNVTVNNEFGCRVCGYTVNQNYAFKKLTSSNCRCYRVKNTFAGNGSEKRISLPLSGSGATVL